MRNPERIPVLLDLFKEAWQHYPDCRFNQFVYSLQVEYNIGVNRAYSRELWEREEFRGIVSYRKTTTLDLFAVEDDEFITFLKEWVDIRKK